VKSLLLSTLRAQFASKGADALKAAHPHAWLLWEPGNWKPPAKRTMVFSAVGPGSKSSGGEALALALDGAQQMVLGRDPLCDLVINDGTLSARHLLLTRSGTGWTVADAGSSNGTKLQGAALAANDPRPLLEGARLEAAQVILTYWTAEGLWRRLAP
jgi:hypothetical protein